MDSNKRAILNSIYFLLGTAITNIAGFDFRIIVVCDFELNRQGLFSQTIHVILAASTLTPIGLNEGSSSCQSIMRDGERREQVGPILTVFSVVALLITVLTVGLYFSLWGRETRLDF